MNDNPWRSVQWLGGPVVGEGLGVSLPAAGAYEECLATSAPAELRPPAEHQGKPWHWLESPAGTTVPVLNGTQEWLSCAALGYRYLGPAEWRPEDPEVLREALNAQTEACVTLVHENALLRDRLASVEAHNAELVAKYEGLLSVTARGLGRSTDVSRETFPATALGHAPKAGPR